MGNEESSNEPSNFNQFFNITVERIKHPNYTKGSVVNVEIIPQKRFIVPSYCKSKEKVHMNSSCRQIRLDGFEGQKEIKFNISRSILYSASLYAIVNIKKIPSDEDYKFSLNLYNLEGKRDGKIFLTVFASGVKTQREELLKYARTDENRQIIVISKKEDSDKSLQKAHYTVILKILEFLKNHDDIIEVNRIQTKIVDDFIISCAAKFKFLDHFIKQSKESILEPVNNRVVSIIVPRREDVLKIKNLIDDNDQIVVGFQKIELSLGNSILGNKIKLVVCILNDSKKVLEKRKIHTSINDCRKEFLTFNLDDETKMIKIEVSKGNMGIYKSIGIVQFSIKYCLENAKGHKIKLPCEIYNPKNEDIVFGKVFLDIECYSSQIKDLFRYQKGPQLYRGNFGEKYKKDYIVKDDGGFRTSMSARCRATRFTMKYKDQIEVFSIDECIMLKYNRTEKKSSYDDSSCVDSVKVWYKIIKGVNEKEKKDSIILDINKIVI